MIILSADIGGTNTRLQLSRYEEGELEVLHHQKYINTRYDSLSEIVNHFLTEHQVKTFDIDCAGLAVAGPIVEHTVKFTNLPWFVERDALRNELGIKKLELINDFQAIGYGIEMLNDADYVVLQKGLPEEQATKAIMGAGTGLGVAFMTHQSNGNYQVFATEGGHVEFAPTDEEQMALSSYLRQKFHRVSVERVVSGIGLTNIYKFVRDNPQYGEEENPKLRLAIHKEQKIEDLPATIAEFAKQQDPLAKRALELFIKAYGSAAGNLALTTLPRGGFYLVGGIAPKLINYLKTGPFLHAFNDKGRMSKIIEDIPVYVVLDTLIGLKGAAVFASRL